jgi:membrane-anchored mycosin MYCP
VITTVLAAALLLTPVVSEDPPAPPAARSAAPAGARPGPAPGLRAVDGTCGVAGPAGAAVSDLTRRLQLDDVHAIARGTGVTVAVIDTGVAPGPAFGARLRGGGDYVAGGDGLSDCDGHGTAVAGLIAGRATDQRSDALQGVAPDATVLAIRQLSERYTVTRPDGTSGPPGDTGQLAAAIVLAVREGAQVINISEVSCLRAGDARGKGDVLHAALEVAARADVVVVAAAGNTGATSDDDACVDPAQRPDQVSLPGWYDDDVLTVGAVDELDRPASFTVPGAWVDVAAPGTNMLSVGTASPTVNGLNGTSYSAPLVSGLVALVRQHYPELTARQVIDRVVATARRPGGVRTATLGHGVVDPLAALTALPAVLDPDAPAPSATVPLPGTTPVPAPAEPRFPVDLAVVVALAAACVFGAQRLRRR